MTNRDRQYIMFFSISETLAKAVEQINRDVEKLSEKQADSGKQITQNETEASKTVSR